MDWLWQDHPPARYLLQAYLDSIERARDHVLQGKASVNLPGSHDQTRIVGYHTPPAQQPLSPFGDFLNPAPFSTDRTGYLMLHPVEVGDEKTLGNHCHHFIEVGSFKIESVEM